MFLRRTVTLVSPDALAVNCAPKASFSRSVTGQFEPHHRGLRSRPGSIQGNTLDIDQFASNIADRASAGSDPSADQHDRTATGKQEHSSRHQEPKNLLQSFQDMHLSFIRFSFALPEVDPCSGSLSAKVIRARSLPQVPQNPTSEIKLLVLSSSLPKRTRLFA